jgi:hypothetical protein
MTAHMMLFYQLRGKERYLNVYAVAKGASQQLCCDRGGAAGQVGLRASVHGKFILMDCSAMSKSGSTEHPVLCSERQADCSST